MSKRFRASRVVPLGVVVGSIALSPACIIPIGGAEVGDLRVTWSFTNNGDATQNCSEVGVDTLDLQLIGATEDDNTSAEARGDTADCIAGSLLLQDLVAGRYILNATGTGEVAVFSNGDADEDKRTVEVVAGQETNVDSNLTLANGDVVARIEFSYTFSGTSGCSDAGVQTVRAQVIDENGVAIAGSETDCIAGLAAVEGIRIGTHTLSVEAVDGDGNVLFTASRPLTGLQAGKTLRLDLIDLAATTVNADVRYSFDGTTRCSDVGVEVVTAQLLSDANEVVAGVNVPCIAGLVNFTGVPAGTYRLRMEGLNGDNVVLFQQEVANRVLSEANNDLGVVDLNALSSEVRVRFVFPDGQRCAEVGVQNLDVQVIDSDGGVAGANVACVAGQAVLQGPVPGTATVTVDGIAGTDVTFSATRDDIELEPGVNDVEIELQAVRSTVELSWDFLLRSDDNIVDTTPAFEEPTASCTRSDVDNINIRLLSGTRLLTAITAACTAGLVAIPAVDVGLVTVEIEGTRQAEGDSIFFKSQTINVNGARTSANVRLEPSLVFARVLWANDCAVTGSATVDLQITAGSSTAGVNVPCANGNALIALPPGSEDAQVQLTLRGVSGQGDPRGIRELIGPISVVTGINTFRFAGPSN